MENRPAIIQRYIEDGRILRLGLSHLSLPARTVGAAVVLFPGDDRQGLIDRARRVLGMGPAKVIRALDELEHAGVIRRRNAKDPGAGYDVCDENEWRVRYG